MEEPLDTLSLSTSTTLLRDVAADSNSPRWDEFARIYAPLIKRYVEQFKGKAFLIPDSDIDDISQDVFVSIFKSMRGFTYERSRGGFRHYLKRAVSNLITRFGIQAVEESRRTLRIDSDVVVDLGSMPDEADDDHAMMLHVWSLALSRVLQSGRFAPNTKALFRRLVIEDTPVNVVAAEFKKTPNNIYQIKDRVMRSVHNELLSHGLGNKSLVEIQESLEIASKATG